MLSCNKAPYVEESVRSVIAQTYTNWELLFVDDNSGDDTINRMMTLKEEGRLQLPDGRRIPLARGASGMHQFRMNRCRRCGARLLRSIGRLVEPIMFWRVRLTETKQFGEDVFYYAGKRAIAKKTENGPRFLKSYWKLLYKV